MDGWFVGLGLQYLHCNCGGIFEGERAERAQSRGVNLVVCRSLFQMKITGLMCKDNILNIKFSFDVNTLHLT